MTEHSGTAKRILLKISGEALTRREAHHAFQLDALDETAQILANAHHDGLQIAAVCGGGNIVRGSVLMHDCAVSHDKKHFLHRADADKIGMLATVMNCLALQSSIRALNVPVALFSALPIQGLVPAFNRHEAMAALAHGAIVLLAGGIGRPYFTTDSTAVLRALELECDMVVKATKVNGVYDDDPETNPKAKRYERLHYQTAITKKLKIMDQTAFTLAEENRMPIAVIGLHEKNALKDLHQGTGCFTIISDDKDDDNA